jgi:predicted nuclease with RNAse H fold
VLTLGIDLASQPLHTAACFIEWSAGRARVGRVAVNLTDTDVLGMVDDADKAGIDAPFGWPDEFVGAVSAHSAMRLWPDVELTELRYRYTDRVQIRRARRPLSVSSDLIAVTAMRCARLLSALDVRGQHVDRSGTGKVVEVYPAAALTVWGFNPAGYKRAVGIEARRILVKELLNSTGAWLETDDDVVELLIRSDDCLDALVASLVARAAALDLTEPPPEPRLEQVQREGWIHLPTKESLSLLATPH